MWGPEHPRGRLPQPCGPQAPRGLQPSQGSAALFPGEPGALSVPQFQGLLTWFFQELNANLSNLTSAFEKATAEKIKCQQEADATNRVISLANRCLAPPPHHKTRPVLRPPPTKRMSPQYGLWGDKPQVQPPLSEQRVIRINPGRSPGCLPGLR